MKKKRLNKVLNIVVTLMAAIALMLGNVTSVAAYTDINGYPFLLAEMLLTVYGYDSNALVLRQNDLGIAQEQNSYMWNVTDMTSFDDIYQVRIGNLDCTCVIPYEPNLYDYYLVGTFASKVMADDFTFFPTEALMYYYNDDGSLESDYSDIDDYYNFNSYSVNGFSFVCSLDFSNNSTLSQIVFVNENYEGSKIGTTSYFSGSIVPVPKSGSEADTLSSILAALTQINQNIITSNTLQQQTIDAINQNTTNTSNWFTSLISNLSTWYYQRKEDLSNWFLDIDNRLSSGFAALYSQMTKEQDEKLNGYDDTTQSDAADNFNTESDKLTELEGQLNDQSHDFVSDYTTTGFNTGVLSTLSSSLIFVTTWFANFWNMGGIFTAGLNLCFSLSIVFFILRLRR